MTDLLMTQELIDRRTGVFRLTVDQYRRMLEQGILPEGEPVELLNGQLVAKDRSAERANPITVGHEHAWVVTAIEELNPKLRRLGCFARIQQPISLPPFDEPEPDVAIVRGKKEDYDHHPTAPDVLCAIEVADASLRRDRTVKLRTYAEGGVRQYLIFNLPDRVVEVHTGPMPRSGRYRQSNTLSLGETLTLPTTRGKGVIVPVRSLFPPPRQAARGSGNGRKR